MRMLSRTVTVLSAALSLMAAVLFLIVAPALGVAIVAGLALVVYGSTRSSPALALRSLFIGMMTSIWSFAYLMETAHRHRKRWFSLASIDSTVRTTWSRLVSFRDFMSALRTRVAYAHMGPDCGHTTTADSGVTNGFDDTNGRRFLGAGLPVLA